MNIGEYLLRRSRDNYLPMFTESEVYNYFSTMSRGELENNGPKKGKTDVNVRLYTRMEP